MPYEPKTVYIVSHTHWDREWYQTFHEFRVNLSKVVKKVLEYLESDSDFKHFLMDGQSVILEDYLEINPDDEEEISLDVQVGSLSIGPWYILPDEFIIGAESHARNLLYGNKVASRFGKAQKAGYMPDSFGHIAQIPQILKLAGIDSFIFTRGCGDEIDQTGYEFIWQAPDGSEVIAINQCDGYCSGGGLGFDEIWHAHTRRTVVAQKAIDRVRSIFEHMGKLTNGDIVLLNNGCDHLPPQQEFSMILKALKKEFPSTEFKHAGLVDFIKAVKKAGFVTKKYSGELIRGKYQFILPGVWSARVNLKQKNDEAQSLLADYLEPISAYSQFMLKSEYPSGLIEYCWKLLLKNHPHDSICGCSTDEVHREMLPRFDGVIQSAKQSISEQMERLSPTFARDAVDDKHTSICVINTLPVDRTEIVERLIVLQPSAINTDKLRLLDQDGKEVQFKIINKWYAERFWGVDYRTTLETKTQIEKFYGYLDTFRERMLKDESQKEKADCFLLIQFVANMPALTHRLYYLTERSSSGATALLHDRVSVDGSVIENSFCRVDVHSNGSFDLLDKKSGKSYPGLNTLEDTEDAGDEYDYSPCEKSSTVTSVNAEGKLTVIESGGLSGVIEADFVFKLPAKLNKDRKSRTSDIVGCPVKFRIGLKAESPVVDIEMIFDNRAEDHRLRAHFPVGFKTNNVISDGHFYTNVRPIDQPSGEGWAQPPYGIYPQQDFSLLQDFKGGLAILNRGLHEFEPIRNQNDTTSIALTLLRCVGWLSRDDFVTRKCQNAGPTIATPDAQCPGVNRIHYAVVPYSGNWIDAGIKHINRKWRTPLVMVQGVEDQSVKGIASLVKTTSLKTCITAIKKTEQNDNLLIRLYNLSGDTIDESLEFGRDIQKAWKVNLLEERQTEIKKPDKRILEFTINPYEILNLEIHFK